MTMVLKTQVIQDTGTVTMGTSDIVQTRQTVPEHGDLKGLILELTQSTSGTLTTPNKLAVAIKSIDIFDKNGKTVFSSIRGTDLKILHLLGGQGQSPTETDSANASNTDRYFIPFRVDAHVHPLKFQVTIAPYTDMAASGETGGSTRLITTGVFDDDEKNQVVERVSRVQKSLVSGANSYGPDILKDQLIMATYFKVGTESNITDITFTSDGALELDKVTPGMLTAIDNQALIDGHQTGLFNLWHSPYVSTSKSLLNVTGAGSDTLDFIFRMQDRN